MSASLTAPTASEDLSFTAEQQAAYDAAQEYLNESASSFLAIIPKLVSVSSELPASDQEQVVTLISPARGHHELFRALELLEGLEKEEQTLAAQLPLTRQLTLLLMQQDDDSKNNSSNYNNNNSPPLLQDSVQALQALATVGRAVPRRVCQHPFKKNDIVWVCRTCQADETCVLCHACFSQSQHEGHDVAFYHAQAGGCCDCGDPDGACVRASSVM